MINKQNFEQRLEELGITLYKLAKQYSEMRAVEGDVSPATRYHSAISKAIENPAKSKLETVEAIVRVLNGELKIIWEPGKVVILQLNAEDMAYLERRAKAENISITETAKQLLQLALTNALAQRPKEITELVVTEETKIDRSMHPSIASAYSAVHQWLATKSEVKGYKELEYSKYIRQALEKKDFKSLAFQYYTLFPEYFFQATHVLDKVINSTRLQSLLKYNPQICVIDVGCTFGAASAALIERIVTLQESENITNSIDIVCLAVDSNLDGLAIYKELIEQIKQNIYININLEIIPIPLLKGFSKAIIQAMRHLQTKRKEWKRSFLSNLLIMQLDVAYSPHQDELSKLKQYIKLEELGLQSDYIEDTEDELWHEEILGYKQLLEQIPIQEMYILTIATKKLEKYIQDFTNFDHVNTGINKISQSFKNIFKTNVSPLIYAKDTVNFKNPQDSYLFNLKKVNSSIDFYYNIDIVNNDTIKADNDWENLISLENLELAWVRARNNLLNESLYDEMEILIFENNLNKNLKRVRNKLISLDLDTIFKNQDISYNFPKSFITTRLKQITRLEEEIIAVAIIQTVGKRAKREFYSYSIQSDVGVTATEELYEHWFDLYKTFIKDVKSSAMQYQDGVAIRTDIKSYYTEIIQEKLVDATVRELEIMNERIIYLLKKIFLINLDGHEIGKGIKQGTMTSGFYQNLFLSELDDALKNYTKSPIKYHRYVDDMVIIVPSIKHLKDVKTILNKKLGQYELKLNEDKTEEYHTISEFLTILEDDKILENLHDEFQDVVYPLWVMNNDYKNYFYNANQDDNNYEWWRLIKIYQQCLHSIKIYVDEKYLSRRIYQHLFQTKMSKSYELQFPAFPSNYNFNTISNWFNIFTNLGIGWLDRKKSLKQNLVKLFYESLQDIKIVMQNLKADINLKLKEKQQMLAKQRLLESRIRFTINKLAVLGFEDVAQGIIDFICADLNKTDLNDLEQLFIIRNLLHVFTSLARQGHTSATKTLLSHFQNSNIRFSEYIRAVAIEALRFLPSFDINDWEFIFEAAVNGKSNIERLKATETWLFLADVAKQFVQSTHIQSIVNALKSNPQPFTRLRKNYILILGMYENINTIYDIFIEESDDDYLIQDTLTLVKQGKVGELIKQKEPSIIRHYYSVKQPSDKEPSDNKKAYKYSLF